MKTIREILLFNIAVELQLPIFLQINLKYFTRILSNTENLNMKAISHEWAKVRYYFICTIEARNRFSASEHEADSDESCAGICHHK